MRKLKWTIYSAAIGLLLLGVTSVSGQEGEETARRGLVGEVTGLSQTEDGAITAISIVTEQGEEVAVQLPDGLEPVTPGQPAVTGVAGSLGLGAQVAVLAKQGADGELIAVQVLLKPGSPTPPVNGVVIEVDSEQKTITVLTADGDEHTLRLPDEALLPEVGDMVTAFRGPSSSTEEEDSDEDEAPAQATGLVKADEIRARLQRHAEELTGEDAELTGLDEDERAERLEDVRQLLDTHTARHVEALDRVLLLVPEQARQSIEMAKGKAQTGRQQAIEAIDRAMGKAGGPPFHRPGKPDEEDTPHDADYDSGQPESTRPGETPETTPPPVNTPGGQPSTTPGGSSPPQGGQGQQGGAGGRP